MASVYMHSFTDEAGLTGLYNYYTVDMTGPFPFVVIRSGTKTTDN